MKRGREKARSELSLSYSPFEEEPELEGRGDRGAGKTLAEAT